MICAFPHSKEVSGNPGHQKCVPVDEIITPSQVAALLKIHVKTVYKLAREGVIVGNRIGRSWRFSKNHVLDLLFQQEAKLPVSGEAKAIGRQRSL